VVLETNWRIAKAMRCLGKCAGLLVASQILSGCVVALVYSHTTEPLSLDLHSTPAASDHSSGATKRVKYYVEVRWDNNGIGAIAKRYGFDEIDYADLETLRILGVFERKTVHVYGTREVSSSTGSQATGVPPTSESSPAP